MQTHAAALAALLALCAPAVARADAVLDGDDSRAHPRRISIDVAVRAQVETTEMVLEFGDVTAGDYVLTVPSPERAYPIGVDVDRGAGFFQAPMVGEAPGPAFGGSEGTSDPETTAWVGKTPLVADLAELASGPLTVRVRFQRLLRRHRGEVSFEIGSRRSPLRAAGDPGAEVTVALSTQTFRPLVTFDAIGADRSSIEGSRASAEAGGRGDVLLAVRYREADSGSEIDVHFLAHRTPDADPLGGDAGYFLLVADADATVPSAAPRTVNLIIDSSGSMSGAKIAQARETAQIMLDFLEPGDRFNIVEFDSSVRRFASSPVDAGETPIGDARDWVRDIRADGTTDLDGAVQSGLGALDVEAGRFDAVVLLSDGVPTEGVTDASDITRRAREANRAEARLYTFSIGGDADRPLMEALAADSGGRHVILNNAEADEDLVARATELFEDIRAVALYDPSLSIAGIGAAELQPGELTDVFAGGQAIVVGRYDTPGTARITVSGEAGGSTFERSIDGVAPALQGDNAFIKHVWATETVDALLADMARGGDESALRDRIEAIGLGYRIQTPYTSFSTRGLGGGGTGGGGGGGGGGGSGGYGGGDVGPFELVAVMLLAFVALWRRRGAAITGV